MWYIGTSLIHFDELLVVGILEKSQPIVGYHYHKKVTSLFHEDNLGPIQITWSFSTNQRPVSRSRDHPRPIREQHLWSLDHYFPKIILDSFLVSFSPPPLEALLSDSLELAPVSSLWRTWSWSGVNTLQCRENSLNIIDSSSSWWGNVKKETTFTSSSYSLVHIGTFFCSKRIFLPLAKYCPLPGSGWRCWPPSPRAAHSASPCAAQCPAAESWPESSSSSSSSCPAAGSSPASGLSAAWRAPLPPSSWPPPPRPSCRRRSWGQHQFSVSQWEVSVISVSANERPVSAQSRPRPIRELYLPDDHVLAARVQDVRGVHVSLLHHGREAAAQKNKLKQDL